MVYVIVSLGVIFHIWFKMLIDFLVSFLGLTEKSNVMMKATMKNLNKQGEYKLQFAVKTI